MVKEELGLPSHCLLELLVEVGVGAHVRMQPVEVGQPKPLGREPCSERLGPRVGQHPADLPHEHVRLREPPLVGQLHELGVRPRRPQEERQTRRKVVTGDGEAVGRSHVDRWLFEAEHEVRAREDALQRHPHPGFEAALGLAGVIQRHQTLGVVGRQRSPVGGAAQPPDDRVRTGARLGRRCRPAAEDARAARRVRDAGGVERAADGEVTQMRQTREAVRIGDAGARERPLVGRDQVLSRSVEPTHEDGRHAMRSGTDPDRVGPEIDAVGVRDVHPAVNVEQRRAPAIHRDLDLLRAVRCV